MMSLEGPQSASYCPPNPPFPTETAEVGYCPKSRLLLFTIITLKSDSWFRSTGDFCGRLYRSRVLMSSSGAVANGVVSGVGGKRPRWDYHSQGGLRKVLPAQALRVRATHFRGQGKLSNEQPGLLLPSFKDYTIVTVKLQPLYKPTWCKDEDTRVLLLSLHTKADYKWRSSPPCRDRTLLL